MSVAESVKYGLVVSMDYILIVGEQVMDASAPGKPLQFIQGLGMIIPGLERALYGMWIGESKQVVVAPREGYGETNPEAQVQVDRQRFPPSMAIEPGMTVQMRAQDGTVRNAQIVDIQPDSVRLDFNHPMAGKELKFAVKIVALREASEEEINDRHIH